jgi:hypothetical protein
MSMEEIVVTRTVAGIAVPRIMGSDGVSVDSAAGGRRDEGMKESEIVNEEDCLKLSVLVNISEGVMIELAENIPEGVK